jgi:hypothetical protein
MKDFNDIFEPFGADLSPMDMATKMAASGFGIVLARDWDTRKPDKPNLWTDSSAMASPLYDMDAITEIVNAPANKPYFTALGTLGESQLTVIDVDNGHGDRPKAEFSEFWSLFVEFCLSIGCDEDDLKTVIIRSPGNGIHAYFSSDVAPLFSWLVGAEDKRLGDAISIDWLTPGSNRHEYGPGNVKPRFGRYDMYVPIGSDTTNLMSLVKPLPDALLRWLVESFMTQKESHPGKTIADCFRSPIAMEKAKKVKAISDLIATHSRKKKKTISESTTISMASCDAKLWESRDVVRSGSRHNELTSFAGTCVNRITGPDFESTLKMIEAEIRNFAEHRCEPSLPFSEVAAVVRFAIEKAHQQREDIERRIASRCVVKTSDGTMVTQVLDDFCHRVVNGASYRCKLRKGGKAGLPISSPANVTAALEQDEGLRGCFGYDLMNCRNCIVNPLPWSSQTEEFPRFVTDADIGRIISYIDEVASFDPTRNFRLAFNDVCSRHSFNPLQDFVHGFEGKWDGKNHMDLLSRWMGVDSDDIVDGNSFSETCLTLMMRGAIRRALRPGCQFDYILILQGDQGIGKSNFWRRLATHHDWFCESLTDIGDSKKCFEQISSSWLVNIDELAALRSQKDITRVKTFLTQTHDDYRAPYKSEQERIQRHCVFVGTTNETSFLSDRSGNRRFILIPCLGVFDAENKIEFFDSDEFGYEIEQAWSQAYAMEQAHPEEALILPQWAIVEQNRRNGGASVVDPTEEGLERIFTDYHMSEEPLCYAQIWSMIHDKPQAEYLQERHLKSFQDACRRVARRLGWTEGRFSGTWGIGDKKSQKRGFLPVLTDDERAELKARRERIAADEESWTASIASSTVSDYDSYFSPMVDFATM